MSESTPARTAAVLLAAGSGTRVGAELNKVLLPLHGIAILARSLRTVLAVEGVRRIVVVARPQDLDAVRDTVSPYLGARELWLVDGGASRHLSEWHALRTLAAEIDDDQIDVVAIHDAARPLAPPSLWRAVIDAAAEHGGAIPVQELPRLSHRNGSLAKQGLVAVQTPQAFRADELLSAHRRADAEGYAGTDTAACLERHSDVFVAGVPSTAANLKVTYPEDVELAETLLTEQS